MNRWLIAAAGALLLVLGGAFGASHYQGLKQERDELRFELTAAHVQIETLASIERTTSIVLSNRAQSKAAIKEHTSHVQAQIETQLPRSAGSSLPAGFRVLHDAAASGEPIPPATGRADGPAIPAQEIADTVTGNYATCRDVADQLSALQAWIRGVSQ